jgi:hypothetical protein
VLRPPLERPIACFCSAAFHMWTSDNRGWRLIRR